MKKLTRQKEETLKKIGELEKRIDIDMELSCGMAPPGAYDAMYKEIYRLQDKLASLTHYKTAEEMFLDVRGQTDAELLSQVKPRNKKPSKHRKEPSR